MTRFKLETYDGKLSLIDEKNKFTPFYIDFEQIQKRTNPESLAKAIGSTKNKRLFVIDATAGLGQDSFFLARLGCQVLLLEKDPVVGALLADGLKRAQQNPLLKPILDNIIELKQTDSVSFLSTLAPKQAPDVIYLDPMFPKRPKTALVKKPMQILQAMVQKTETEHALLEMALNCATKRVVFKRPNFRTAHSTAYQPHHIIKSKTIFFEIYLPNSKSQRYTENNI